MDDPYVILIGWDEEATNDKVGDKSRRRRIEDDDNTR